jgi:hypothetical protein
MSHEDQLPYLRPEHEDMHRQHIEGMQHLEAASELPTADDKPVTTLSKLNALPLDEFTRRAAISELRNLVTEGAINSVEFAIKCAALEKFIKELRADKSIKDVVAKDAKDWKGESLYGHTISVSLRKEWAYNDSELYFLEAQAKAIDEKIKARQKMLQSLTAPMADTNGGEIINPAKVVKLTEIVTVKESK